MPNLAQNENFALKCTSLLSNVHFWHLKKNFKFLKKWQICHNMNIFRKNDKFATIWTFSSQMYIIALKCTSLLSNVHLKNNFKFSKKLQICHKMNILLANVHHALKCTFFLTFFDIFQKKLQIFEKMPNLPQNENFALKCTSLLSNVHFLTFKKTL